MNYLYRNVGVYENGKLFRRNVCIRAGRLSFPKQLTEKDNAADGGSLYIFPGFADVHVHLREPGFSYKETIRSGTMAAARGGYTTVCPMPNLNPVPDSVRTLQEELALIRRDALIRVFPYGAITKGEKGQILSDMADMAKDVCAFSDDGKGVQNAAIMTAAMEQGKRLHKIITAHCEDETLLRGGYIHDGAYAAAHGHRGISSESEWKPIERDAALALKTGCAFHVCHVSTKQSVEVIRRAKAAGADITCETAPHYLLLNDSMLREEGCFKMNPPIRSEEDRQALLEGLLDGTIDMIATDHAPHSAEEKDRGLEKSLMGIVGLETAFPVLYTELVAPGILPLERLTALMSDKPRERFGLTAEGDFTLFDLDAEYNINPEEFLSMGRSTPFAGKTVRGRCLMTVCGGRTVWCDKSISNGGGAL